MIGSNCQFHQQDGTKPKSTAYGRNCAVQFHQNKTKCFRQQLLCLEPHFQLIKQRPSPETVPEVEFVRRVSKKDKFLR